MTEAILNVQQQEALELACQVATEGAQFFGLFGAGGVGKTFCAQSIVSALKGILGTNQAIYLAPNNSVLGNLKEGVSDNTAQFRTLHSITEKRPGWSDRGRKQFTGKVSKINDKHPLVDCGIVIVDEISMVDTMIFTDFLKLIEEYSALRVKFGKKPLFVIGMGDSEQHFPVGEKSCPFIDFIKSRGHYYTLTIQMRQNSNNPITEIIDESRQSVINRAPNYDPRWNYRETCTTKIDDRTVGYWYYDDEYKAFKQVRNAYRKMLETGDWNLGKFVCWKNDTVRRINREIRQALFGADSVIDYLPGDLIVCKGMVEEEIAVSWSDSLVKKGVLFTGDELVVIKATRTEHQFEWLEYSATPAGNIQFVAEHTEIYKTWLIEAKLKNQVNDETKRAYTVQIIANDHIDYFNAIQEKLRHQAIAIKKAQNERIKRIKDNKKFIATDLKVPKKWQSRVDEICNQHKTPWIDFYQHNDMLHAFLPAYACTTHLAQGKTFKFVFFDPDELHGNSYCIDTRNRIKYVGMSRAKDGLVLVPLLPTEDTGTEDDEAVILRCRLENEAMLLEREQTTKDKQMFEQLASF